MRFYIADQHFYHKNLIPRMDKRPFENVEEMNEYMINQWNKKVRKNDEVVVLGDLSFGNAQQTNEIVEALNGKIYLIQGNHDHKFLKSKDFKIDRLGWVKQYHEMSDNNRKVILSHYPTFCYNGQYRKDEKGNPTTYMLYGHVHNTHDQKLVDKFVMETRNTKVLSKNSTTPEPIPCNMINCFCMYSDYQPLTLDEWIAVNEKRMTENMTKEN